MLGEGRPFVVSVRWAKRRRLDADEVAREVARLSKGRVEVRDVRVVDRPTASRITSDHAEKTYRAVVRTTDGSPLPADAAERLSALAGAEIRQRTPERVERRRADLVRVRGVLALTVEEMRTEEAVVLLRTDPGTYVKELVSGDEGRTEPSFSSILGQPCFCAELDVVSAGTAGTAATAGAAGAAGASAPGTTL
jgi:tRNA pseudouridine synthase 10